MSHSLGADSAATAECPEPRLFPDRRVGVLFLNPWLKKRPWVFHRRVYFYCDVLLLH